MGSTRFPGKVLHPLAGKPVLGHIVHRLRKCRSLDGIAVATSVNHADNPIEAFARSENIPVIRGPEENVLARFLLAAETLGAEIIARITGDAPLIDPGWIDCLVEGLIRKQVDYYVPDPKIPSIHEGLDPFTVRALRKLFREAGDDPVAREHLAAYFHRHPGFVRVEYAPLDPDFRFEGARVSVDTPLDLHFLEEVYRRLAVHPGEADLREVVRLLQADPLLLKINTHIRRKQVDQPTRRVLFRCDGDAQVGLGHIGRCLALANELRDGHGLGVHFALARGPEGSDLLQKAGYPPEKGIENPIEDLWLEEILHRIHPDVLVLDVRSSLSPENVQKWRGEGLLIVTFDDFSGRRLAADLAFYPPVPQVGRLDWEGFTGDRYIGWDWVPLRGEFGRQFPLPLGKPPVVLVTMGGSDPAGLTLKALKALDRLDEFFTTQVVLGPGFSHHEKLRTVLRGAKRDFEVYSNPPCMAEFMGRASLAVASFGVTAYELAAMGVPAVYLSLTPDHAESASLFSREGMAVSLGVHTQVSELVLAQRIRFFLEAPLVCRGLGERARKRLDGKGAKRIAGVIGERINLRG
jgi:spore coat polysaccharide biosynthesis protein SpsF